MNLTEIRQKIAEFQYSYWLFLVAFFGAMIWGSFGNRADSSWLSRTLSSPISLGPILGVLAVISLLQVQNLKRLRDLTEKFERLEQAKQAPSERAPSTLGA